MAQANLDLLINALKEFAKINSGMPVGKALSLLVVAKHEGLGVQEVANEAGMHTVNVSRYILGFRSKTDGLGFVKVEEDPEEIRKKPLYLTPKGRKFVDKLLGVA